MALLNNFLAGLNFPPVTLLKRYLEDGIPEDLQAFTQCAPSDWCLKSSSKSSELRESGNEAYRLRKYDEALTYYSKSIATAPIDSTELALAYGNRSAILQVQKEYELCLLDTNRALNGTIPQSSRTTLLERKAKCWEKLQEQNVMRTKLRAGLPNLKCEKQERTNLMACERQLCYISKVDIDDTDLVIGRSVTDDPEFETTLGNEICENLSPKVQRRVDEEWGQAFIATDDIEPGEILSNDDFYALVVEEGNLQEHCSYCSVWCKALIPCVSCSQDMYCCVGCREKAQDTYHEIECKMLSLWGNISPVERKERRLFLRIFLTGTKQGSNLTNLLNNPQVYAALIGNLGFANVRLSSKDYLPILNSLWKLDSVHDAAKQQLRVQEILETFTGLRHVGYFGADGGVETQCSGNTLTGQELLVVVLLVQNVSISTTQSNQAAAQFWQSQGEGPLKLRRHVIGAAVGPWHTFLNHSCTPNVTKMARGRRVLCLSLRPIKAGEQVFNNVYLAFLRSHQNVFARLSHILKQIFRGSKMSYTMDTLADRKVLSRKFWGRECSCVACVEDWPSMRDLLMSPNRYLTSNRDVIRKIEKMQNWITRVVYHSIGEEDLKKAIEFCKIACQYMNEPAHAILLCESFINQAMNAKENLYFSQKYIASLYNYL